MKVRLKRPSASPRGVVLREKETKPTTERDVLTLSEAADFLRCSTQTLRKLIRNGELACAQYGRLRRVTREELLDFLKRSSRRAPAD